MARARNIKPSFFTNDTLAEIDPLGRLLFAGMWTIADREGRLEDRPKRIKAEVLPYDDCDVDGLLNDLQKHGFILRYEADGQCYIQILAFTKHQNPHVKESASTIPAPDKHSASTVQDTTLTGTSHADSLLPITDSLNPIKPFVASKPADPCPHQKIIDIYHEVLPMCPRVRDWTPARATQLRARWNEDKARQSLDYWQRFFEYVATCDFLVGKVDSNSKEPFFADLEWLTRSKNFVKVREQKYENRGRK